MFFVVKNKEVVHVFNFYQTIKSLFASGTEKLFPQGVFWQI
jgi:hypothetical protein